MHPEVISDKPGNCPICGMKLTPLQRVSSTEKTTPGKKKGKILYWRAPMDPTEIYDRPGKSKMGMDLIPVYEGEEGAGAGIITIDGTIQQNMNLRLARVEKRPLHRTIRAFGKVVFAQDREYTLTTKISGWVEKLYVNTEGESVRLGQPLLEIYSPDLVTTQEELLMALQNYEQLSNSPLPEVRQQAKQLIDLTRQRLKLWDISEREIARIIESGQPFRTITLRAQASGVVTHKAIKEGDRVSPGKPLLHLAALDKVWVEATVYESEFSLLREGQKAVIKLDHLPDVTLQGRVAFIYPFLDSSARAGRVRLVFNNPDYILKPGMDTVVTIQAAISQSSLAVPSEAVIRSGTRNIIFVAHDDGKFEPREVKIGFETDDGYLQVLSGLLENEEIVVSGQFLLDSESRTREAIAKLRAQQKAKKSPPKPFAEEKISSTPPEKKKTKSTKVSSQPVKTRPKGSPPEKAQAPNILDKLYTCSMHPEFLTTNPEARCPECGMKLIPALQIKEKIHLEAAEFYTCEMHPEFLTTNPDARCPECGMKLKKVNQK
jgi:Cu(I)/Ag(I) efflux system membrane fusion protein/cobalt-zinc-cadmium efflux system membrane fusion protein